MAIERAPELEELVEQANEAYRAGDFDTVVASLSEDDALLVVGTDPDELWQGREEIVESLRAEMASRGEEGSPQSSTSESHGFRSGDIGWVFTRGQFGLADGSEIPTRTISILQRENGDWKFVQFVSSIAVPNSALEAGSPLAAGLSRAAR
ncbi:MAG: nuclear transport factor 2 family protein [Gaiellaceae bacterium]